MTIQSQTNKISYAGNGGTTTFTYNFLISANTWLNVYVNGVLQTLTTNYSVTGVGNGSGGNVVFVTAPARDASVVIARTNIPQTQLTDYTPNDPFPAETHEAALDKLTMLIQQAQEAANRAIKLSATDTTNDITELNNDSRNDRLLMFNSATGNAQVSDRTYTYINQQMDNISSFIAQGISISFPLDLGFVEDTVIYNTYDLGGLS